jgi:hypothetical protein
MGSSDDVNGQVVERTRRGVQSGFGDMQVAGRGLEIAMAEQQLDAAQIGASIEKVRREGMSKHSGLSGLEMPSCLRSF